LIQQSISDKIFPRIIEAKGVSRHRKYQNSKTFNFKEEFLKFTIEGEIDFQRVFFLKVIELVNQIKSLDEI
jgi:hypothetical protein